MDWFTELISTLWLWFGAKIVPDFSFLLVAAPVGLVIVYKGFRWYWRYSMKNAAGSGRFGAYKEVATGRSFEVMFGNLLKGCLLLLVVLTVVMVIVGMGLLMLLSARPF